MGKIGNCLQTVEVCRKKWHKLQYTSAKMINVQYSAAHGQRKK